MTNDTTSFLKFTEQFETALKTDYQLDLLELHYVPYAFGSGMTAYRIKGSIVKVIFDGKDNQAELLISAKHIKYPGSDLTNIFLGNPFDLLTLGISKLKNQLL